MNLEKEAGKKVPASLTVFVYNLNAVSSWQFRSSFQTPNQPNSFRGGETTNYFLKENSSVPLPFIPLLYLFLQIFVLAR